MKAIVLINIQMGEIQNAVRDLRRLGTVAEAHLTFGPYDAIAIINTQDLTSLGKIISWDIQTIPGVRETCTCVMVDAEIPEAGAAAEQAGSLLNMN